MIRAGTTITGTAAERIGLAPIRAGQVYAETDTGALYIADEVPAWDYFPRLVPGILTIREATAVNPVLVLQTTDDDATNPPLQIQDSIATPLLEIHSFGGIGNVSIGLLTGANLAAGGTYNFLGGYEAGNALTTGSSNVAIGRRALLVNQTADSNFALGDLAMDSATGRENVAIGSQTLRSTTSYGNVAIGRRALRDLIGGHSNIAVGEQSLFSNVAGNANVAIGAVALFNTLTSSNVGIGFSAGYFQQSGSSNVVIGAVAGQGTALHNTSRNTIIGNSAGADIQTGSNNLVLIGESAGANLTTGGGNVFIGRRAGLTATTTTYSVFIGYRAGENEAGDNKLYIANSETATPLIYGEFDNQQAGVNVGTATLAAAWHVDQPIDDAAVPVLLLDQADVDQDMIEFVCTIGVGNAIEAVGVKVLTVTHFIKVTLPGPLTRYIPVGTIA